MPDKAQDDDLVMSLVDLALARPAEEREAYVQTACAGDTRLFSQVWNYVQWEQRMNGFLLDPLPTPTSEEHPFEPGELLESRFRIVREVAQGGMGVVYEAVDEKLQRRIALKCAKAGFSNRLPPEVRHASEISHPNICKTFEIHTAFTPRGEIDFLTMEFLEGETLAERLRGGPLSPEQARTIARQLCDGLAAAHQSQVIHGDLKSNNVILTIAADGAIRAVITDFGLARRPEAALRSGQSGQAGGTPDYMAPELWKGEKASLASDVYALGVILRELASARRVIGRCLEPDQRWPSKPIVDAVIQQAFHNGVTDLSLVDLVVANLAQTPFQIFHVNLPDLAGPVGVGNATLVSWRFLASGGPGAALIGEVPLSTADSGWLMTGLWQGPHVAEIIQEYLNLERLDDVQTQDYDLQIMSIPGLLIEAFWLKSNGPGPDLVIPFVTRSKQLEHFQRYTMDDFLGIVRPLAAKRILFDDTENGAGS